ncbi:MAG TPA: hypothetical protein VIK86_07990 [Candidatus Paceibacterota bacterium]
MVQISNSEYKEMLKLNLIDYSKTTRNCTKTKNHIVVSDPAYSRYQNIQANKLLRKSK